MGPQHLDEPKSASVAAKMSWASCRTTSRIEDMAYSLLGLFDIHMPLIYGEGENAFFRLQCEIIQSSPDESIFAWENRWLKSSGLLAQSVSDFAFSNNIIPIQNPYGGKYRKPYRMTNRGLAIELKIVRRQNCKHPNQYGQFLTFLACARDSDKDNPVILAFRTTDGDMSQREDCQEIQFRNQHYAKSDRPAMEILNCHFCNERVDIFTFTRKITAIKNPNSSTRVSLTFEARSRFHLETDITSEGWDLSRLSEGIIMARGAFDSEVGALYSDPFFAPVLNNDSQYLRFADSQYLRFADSQGFKLDIRWWRIHTSIVTTVLEYKFLPGTPDSTMSDLDSSLILPATPLDVGDNHIISIGPRQFLWLKRRLMQGDTEPGDFLVIDITNIDRSDENFLENI